MPCAGPFPDNSAYNRSQQALRDGAVHPPHGLNHDPLENSEAGHYRYRYANQPSHQSDNRHTLKPDLECLHMNSNHIDSNVLLPTY